jgi:hypothetical protein
MRRGGEEEPPAEKRKEWFQDVFREASTESAVFWQLLIT